MMEPFPAPQLRGRVAVREAEIDHLHAEVERLREALRQERCRGNAAMRYGREAARLRREKDALIRALADALHVSESEAWLIARLDVEEPPSRVAFDEGER
jgi:uncharacterized protein YukE